METKPYNELQPGDRVTAILDPAFPSENVTFDETWEVRRVTAYKGKTVAAFLDRGRFWTMHMDDRRVAVLDV